MRDVGLKEYLQLLRRRMWLVLGAMILVPAAAVAVALQQPPLYQTSADVLLRTQNLPSALSGISDPNAYYVDPARVTGTQIAIARLPSMADRVVKALPNEDLSVGEVLGASSVQAITNTDFLRFQVSHEDPELAATLATEYARQYTNYRRQLDTGTVKQALRDLEKRIDQLRAVDDDSTSTGASDVSPTDAESSSAAAGEGDASSAAALADLEEKSRQLQTLLTLSTSNAVVVRRAEGAAQIQPRPVRAAVIGLGLGLILGLGLAFLRDLLDTRLRSSESIESIISLPLLARLDAPSRQLKRDNKLVMLAEPNSSAGEANRVLRMNLEFVTLEREAQVIMVASAEQEEGKSTTFANLAIALARAGRHVVVVDIDLRRPSLRRLFWLPETQPGLTDVVLGHADLEEALAFVPLSSNGRPPEAVEPSEHPDPNGGGGRRFAGQLEVLTAGGVPPDPGEFVGLQRVRALISSLRERAEVVLIDTPPLLQVGDARVIARLADATVVIVRGDRARRPATTELARVLATWPAPPVGFVLTGAEAVDGYSYGGYSGYYGGKKRRAERSERELVQ